jgi:hypothetical protein
LTINNFTTKKTPVKIRSPLLTFNKLYCLALILENPGDQITEKLNEYDYILKKSKTKSKKSDLEN